MKTTYTILLTTGVVILLLALLPGCYTQLATIQDEEQTGYAVQAPDTTYAQAGAAEQYPEAGETIINNYYYDDWHPFHFGYNYYYPSYYWPSYAFSVAYADPWAYDSYWAYDPWWCGTPYLGYGWGQYPGMYYYPPYAAYPAGPGNTYAAANNRTRTFGVTRGGGSRGTVAGSARTGNGYSPTTTAGSDRGGYVPAGRTLDPGSVRPGTASGPATGSNGTNKAAPTRTTGTRVPAYVPGGYSPPATRQPASSGNDDHRARTTGSTRGSSTPSYTPPPSRAPSPTPAPASGGSTGRTTGGTSRGGRDR